MRSTFVLPVVLVGILISALAGTFAGAQVRIPDLMEISTLKLERFSFRVPAPLAMNRSVRKVKSWNTGLTDEVIYSVFFQKGFQITEKSVDLSQPYCVFERSPSEYETTYEAYALRHQAQIEFFPISEDQGVSSRIGNRNGNDPAPGEESFLTVQPYFETKALESEGVSILRCHFLSDPILASLNELKKVVGPSIEFGIPEFDKGGKSDAELLSLYQILRSQIHSGVAHLPTEVELRLGERWSCESVSIERKSEVSPFELAYKSYADTSLLDGASAYPGCYANPVSTYCPDQKNTALVANHGFMRVYLRAYDDLILQEMDIRRDKPSPGFQSDARFIGTGVPASLSGPAFEARSLTVCRKI